MSEPRREMPRVEISPDKGREIVGVFFAALAVICGASLASFDPADPSFLRQISSAPHTHNWIGGFGAEIAAAGFGLLGVTCLLIPLLLAVAAWRRLWPKLRPTVVGRGAGAGLMLLSLPALLQLLLPALPWRGVAIDSGGALGVVLSSALAQRMNFAGALVLLLALCIVGVALLVQTSLGDLLARWRRRFSGALDQWRLARARRAERKEKERSRNRVVVKHLQRVAEEKQERLDKLAGVAAGRRPVADPPSGEVALPPPVGRLDLPLRGSERPADRPVTVRRVAAPSASMAPMAAATPAQTLAGTAAGEGPAKREKQKEFGFVETQAESELPPLNLLQLENEKPTIDEDELVRLGEAIRSRCHEFGVEGTIEGIGPGPVITVFEFQPAPGVKVSQIVNLQDDLALALKAESVRIDRIAGRSTLGVEVPNPRRGMIRLGSMLANDAFRRSPSLLSLAVGMTIHGEPYYADLATMPHLLVAGATGSGKSIGLQSLITSILYKATRDQVQFIFIDPKRIELGVYADIPHLKTEVVVEPKKASNALRWAVAEMEKRYRLLAEVHVR
ncbi:MAG: DNA translocase FtsK 4TM domain-containing protein, partial [Thermoanaerobaculia bacterium]